MQQIRHAEKKPIKISVLRLAGSFQFPVKFNYKREHLKFTFTSDGKIYEREFSKKERKFVFAHFEKAFFSFFFISLRKICCFWQNRWKWTEKRNENVLLMRKCCGKLFLNVWNDKRKLRWKWRKFFGENSWICWHSQSVSFICWKRIQTVGSTLKI